MNNVELPLIEPIYSTYHYAPGSAIIVNNPSIRNFYLNEVMILNCSRYFLSGYTTPEINIENAEISKNPHLEIRYMSLKFLDGCVNRVIRNLIDNGYYVQFEGVDDYYVEGKSWYHERHFNHDGCICGYNQENKTYCIYAYDINWIYQKFWTRQKSFNKGIKSRAQKGKYGYIWGIKAKPELVEFSTKKAIATILEYLDSDMDKYPENGEGKVRGIVVHDYITKYVGKLYDSSIPYERMDRRVFRLIWEQKKAMLERIRCVEKDIQLDNSISNEYEKLVADSNTIRMLYASHHMQQRNSVLPVIQNKLMFIKKREEILLHKLVDEAKGCDRA